MSSDLECPYCKADNDVCHDDGQNYEEGEAHQMECRECGKYFVFYTSIMFYYHPVKADCLNGAEHKWKETTTYPRRYAKMECEDCEERKDLSPERLAEIIAEEVES